jgi:multidrug efflux pump subunit AcrA (membrane-fusion protein)
MAQLGRQSSVAGRQSSVDNSRSSGLDSVPFLPSAPPRWAARALAWVLLAVFAVTAVAVVLVHVPETVSAPFVVVAATGPTTVRALHGGEVTSVRVVDAQGVEAGAPLFTIGSEDVGDRSAERHTLGATLAGGGSRLINERAKYQYQRKADEEEAKRLAERLVALESQTALKERQANLAGEVASRHFQSHEQGLTSWTEAMTSRLEADRLAVALEETRADLAGARREGERLRFQMASRRTEFDEWERSIAEELDRTRTRKGMLDGEGPRAGNAMTVTAPCAGTIVRLLTRSHGVVVNDGEVLAEIVCHDDRLQLELTVPQRGFALVSRGQSVKLRYDAFPYERYGVRHATLRWTSPASMRDSQEGAFRALADLEGPSVHIDGQGRRVLPGMKGQASIIVGRRSLASYALAPLRQLRETMATEPKVGAP